MNTVLDLQNNIHPIDSRPYNEYCGDTIEIILWCQNDLFWTAIHYIPDSQILFKRPFLTRPEAELDFLSRKS